MSYILNALRKSERERLDGHADETLENRIQHKPHAAPKKTSFLLAIIVLANLLFLSYFIWSFSKDKESQGQGKGQAEQVVAEQKQAIKIEPKLNIAGKTIVQQPAAVKQIKEKPQVQSQNSIAEQIKSQRAKKKRYPTKPNRREKQGTELVKQQVKPLSKQPEKLALTEIKADEKQDRDFPYLSELDYDFRRTVPDIDINVYVYAEKKQDRFIMIKMQKYQPGQQIDSDMTLKEIRINSFVIEYKNRIFQIKRK